MKYRRTLFALGMTLVITTAVVMTLTFQPNVPTKNKGPALPDGYMESVSAVILDKFGKVSMKIDTPKMVHYAENDTTDFTTPELTVYHQSPTPWLITASTAQATSGIENVLFRDNVVIHHPADFNNPATVIKTDSLLVHPNANTAETVEAISMTQPNSLITAIGMFADMNSGNIKLLAEVKGEYVPD
jgi:lipopolysaccharide export system protein LptC